MRFKNYLSSSEDLYIGLKKKSDDSVGVKTKEVEKLLKGINRLLEKNYTLKEYKFDIVKEYESPTNILESKNKKRLEAITRKWMIVNEEFEKIKDKHLKKINVDPQEE